MQNTTIEYITKEITFYGQIFVFIAGVIGCLCNFLTFTARELRKNSCSFYFLCGSIFELFSLSFGLTTRFAADHLHSHFQNENRFFCKFRAYFVTSIPLIGTYFIVLSAVDRFLSSSTNVRCRSFCSLKIARRTSICSMFLGLTSSLHILLMYDLRPRCSTLPGIYAIFDGLFVVFWLGAIPHGLMLVFAALTIRNIRQLKRRTSLQINFRFDKKNEANLSVTSRKTFPSLNFRLAFFFIEISRWCSFKLVSARY